MHRSRREWRKDVEGLGKAALKEELMRICRLGPVGSHRFKAHRSVKDGDVSTLKAGIAKAASLLHWSLEWD